jgi:hypothetical protein
VSAKQLSPAGQKVALAVICLIFISVGLSLWIPMFLVPVLDWSQTRKWKERPCTIVDGFGDLPSGDIRFRYEVDDKTYESTGLGTVDTFGPTLWSIKRGTSTVCYVNPRAPHEAVLFNRFDPELFVWCAPLIFVLLPLPALVLGLRKPRPAPEVDPNSIVLERRRMSGCGCVVLLGLLACFGGAAAVIVLLPGFNETIVIRLVYLAPMCFVIFFILLGLVKSFLRLFQPSVTLTVSPRQAAPGQTLEVRWEAKGPIERVKNFCITLEGREETRYRVDGKYRTQREPFATIDVAKGGSRDLRRGMVKVKVPGDTMHSFEHGGRRIVWVFRVSGDIPSEEYPYELALRKGERS